jgi:hypothetical protein
MDRTACTEPQCLYSRAIPLLLLWTVRPVQSLSVCTVELYLYSSYGPYGLYRASVSVQGCTLKNMQHWQEVGQGTSPYGIQAHENRGRMIYNCHIESTTGAATSSRCLYTHGKGPRHILNRNVTQHYCHSESTVGDTPLSDGPRIYKKDEEPPPNFGCQKGDTKGQFHTAGPQYWSDV